MKSKWEDGTWTEIAGWKEKYEPVRDEIHETGKKMGGTVSGEHGIGLIKKKYLSSFLGENQLTVAAGLKVYQNGRFSGSTLFFLIYFLPNPKIKINPSTSA
jgi:FAD/FMN-containing dehydrogenase